ncbi:MAG TPA: hypothetical protein VGD59_01780 [Acidisarcina sp.]
MADFVNNFSPSAPQSVLPADRGDAGVKRSWLFRLPKLSIWDWYAFLLSTASWASINVGGLLFGSDFMLILGLPIVLTTNHKVLFYRPVRRVLVLAGLWLLAQIITDLIRGTEPKDFLRGWLKIGFTMAQFCVIWVLVHNSKKRVVLYAIGLALGTTLRILTFSNPYFVTDPWKFGFAFPASIAVLLYVSFLMRNRYSVYHLLPLVALAMLNVYEAYRSQAFILMITIVATHGYKSLRVSGRTLSKTKLAGIAVVLILASVTVDKVYSYAAAQMWLGEGAYRKFELQSGGEGGVLLGGRSEILASSAAVADSPWIGHGSWPHDPKYLWIMIVRLRSLGYHQLKDDENTQADAQNGTIPAHSALMGAWVEAGIFGAVFWVYILNLLVRYLVNLRGDEPFFAFAMFQVILLAWDILFSPFAAERRFSVTYFLALLLAINYQRDRQQEESKRLPEPHSAPAFATSS